KNTSSSIPGTFLDTGMMTPRHADAMYQPLFIDAYHSSPSSTLAHPGGQMACTYTPLHNVFASGHGGTTAVRNNSIITMYFQLLLSCVLTSARGTSSCFFVGHTPQKNTSSSIPGTFLDTGMMTPRHADAMDQPLFIDAYHSSPSSTLAHP
ncbi:uncharacterized protein ISCGN_006093, partial [Ixodes scapularis]